MTARSELTEAILKGTGTRGVKRVWQTLFGVEQYDVEKVLDAMLRNRVATLEWLSEAEVLPPLPEQNENCVCPVRVKWELLRSTGCSAPHPQQAGVI